MDLLDCSSWAVGGAGKMDEQGLAEKSTLFPLPKPGLFWRSRMSLASLAAFLLVAVPLGPDAPASAKTGGPKAVFLTYLDAVRNEDPKAAKACWVIDDDNKSGALDVIAGFAISRRRVCR